MPKKQINLLVTDTLTYVVDIPVPALPPPPKTASPSVVRKNPFNKAHESSSEDEQTTVSAKDHGTYYKVTPPISTYTPAPIMAQNYPVGGAGEEEDQADGDGIDTECLIGADNP